MALINCPECQKQISDKAKHCVYCGYPLEAEFGNYNLQNQKVDYELSNAICPICKTNEHIVIDNCKDGCKLCGFIFSIVNEEIYQSINLMKIQAIQDMKPRCPKCGSINVQRERRRFASGLRHNQYECATCRNHWR